MSKKSPYNPIEKHPFAPIPLNFLKHEKISPGAKLVYGYLCSCFGKDGRVCPKISSIAAAIGCKDRQVRNLIAELREKRLIRTIRTGRAFEYIFISPKESDRQDIASHDRQDTATQKVCDRQYIAAQEEPDRQNTASRDRQNIASLLYNNKRKQLKENNNVVVAPSEISFLLDRIKNGVNLEDQGLFEALKEGPAKFGRANQKANGNYPGFLATMIRKGWSVPDLNKDQTPPPSNQPSLSISLAGKTILYKGEKYVVDPDTLCIRPESGGVLPIGMIIRGVNKGTIKVIKGV